MLCNGKRLFKDTAWPTSLDLSIFRQIVNFTKEKKNKKERTYMCIESNVILKV